ncbi:MAG: amino acid permease [Parachlamydiaceae bacterium]|nr:amino acid permease [Parachlamydiaceae bacterium]
MQVAESNKFGFWSTVLLGINGIIGSGIFLLPGQIMAHAGNLTIYVYLFVTLLVLSIAWCFAQCSMLFTRNGGSYIYAKEAFGEFIGFEIGMMRWVVGSIAWASLAVAFVTALSAIWPPALFEPMRSIILLTMIGGLGLLNIRGIQVVKGLSNAITIAKILPLIMLALIGIFFIKQSNFIAISEQENAVGTFGSASLILFYTFGGFEILPATAGELKNPTKNIPKAVMIVIAFCAILYFFIQFVTTGILGVDLASSATPIADVAEKLLGTTGKWIVTIAMLVSIGGVNIACSFFTPRAGAAMAEDQMVPLVIAEQNRYGSPSIAIVISVIITSVVALSGNFTQLVMISVIARLTQYITTCIATIVFYKKNNPGITFGKSPMKLVIPVVALMGLFWLLSQATFQQIYLGFGALVLVAPIYFIQKRRVLQQSQNFAIEEQLASSES